MALEKTASFHFVMSAHFHLLDPGAAVQDFGDLVQRDPDRDPQLNGPRDGERAADGGEHPGMRVERAEPRRRSRRVRNTP